MSKVNCEKGYSKQRENKIYIRVNLPGCKNKQTDTETLKFSPKRKKKNLTATAFLLLFRLKNENRSFSSSRKLITAWLVSWSKRKLMSKYTPEKKLRIAQFAVYHLLTFMVSNSAK